ncbi:MAG TPA: adenylate/guanylate cyclase domain-containing protein [Chthoniobacteraceae bacterium]|jgi:adenylate cyclase
MPEAESKKVKPAGTGRWKRKLTRSLLSLVGGFSIAGLGWALVEDSLATGEHRERARPRFGWAFSSLAQSLARLSYDLPFNFRGAADVPEACLVFLDEKSARALGQTYGPWDPRLHAQLVRRLTADGARAVLFDIVFSTPWPDAGAHEEFAAAMRENGRVFLGAALELEDGDGAFQERAIPPQAGLRRAAAGWGLLAFRPVDPDYGVRRIYSGMESVPSATWRMAAFLNPVFENTVEARTERRWLNWYGPAGSFANITYDRALAADGVPAGYFRDRIVCVGGRSTLGTLALGKDEFASPFTGFGRYTPFATGPEVHLTTALNLLRGDWLRRMPAKHEIGVVVLCGLLMGGGLPLFRPLLATLLAMSAAAACGVGAYWLMQNERLWCAWGIVAVVQIPLALAWAIGGRYFVEERGRKELRRAFAHYLSPRMADRISNSEFDLKPGGKVVEASVMFTDLEGFTTLSEKLNDPEKLSDILTRYFTQTTGHVLENDGTIIKYIGDAVLAVWGAPEPNAKHARTAALAACRLHEASHIEVDGRPLRTRIGLHSGPMLAGNLGSAQRFDYTVIGDAVNFAARLEGLNKYLGTSVLISDATRQQMGEGFVTRRLGEFRVLGKSEPVIVHELLGTDVSKDDAPWMGSFAQALAAFCAGELADAEKLFARVEGERGGSDGPSAFYLKTIAGLKDSVPTGWSGVVELSSK